MFWMVDSVQSQLLPENIPLKGFTEKEETILDTVPCLDNKVEKTVLYQVAWGDTLEKIGRVHQVNWRIIAINNNIQDYNYIQAGQVLKIPVEISGKKEIKYYYPWPLKGRITCLYGGRHDKFHHGLDIASPIGTPIKTVDNGKVIFAGWKSIYGLTVIISHDDGRKTLYGHCSKILVGKGQRVLTGQTIAEVGSTGRSTGPHLHFEVYEGGKTVNPLVYLK